MLLSKSDSIQENKKENFEWKLKDFQYKRVLGQGSFGMSLDQSYILGKVKLAYHYITKREYAIKILKKKEQYQNITNLKEEIQALQSVHSPFIVKLFAVLEDEKKIYIVQEFIDCGELEHLIQQRKVLSEEEARFFLCELILALEDLHKLNIATRDLKPANILLSKTGHIKVCDFGLCKKIPKGERTYSYCGTLDYNPPVFYHFSYFLGVITQHCLFLEYLCVWDMTPQRTTGRLESLHMK